jgi:hypothetical protein
VTSEEVRKIDWKINVSIPEPPPKRGGRSTTILVVRDVVARFLSDENADLVRAVVHDFGQRDDMGFDKHGQNLETNDGRFSGKDGYEELLDAAQYYRKWVEEEPGNSHPVRMYDRILMLVMDARLGLRDKDARENALDWEGPSEEKNPASAKRAGTDGTKGYSINLLP